MPWRIRTRIGSIAAEHAAALVVLLLCFMYPLCNLATMCYRYSLLVQAVHNGAHAASTAKTFSAGSSSEAVMDVVPLTVNNFLKSVKGLKNPVISIRLVSTKLLDQATTRLAQSTKLGEPAKESEIYSVELTVSADIEPMLSFQGGLVPHVPGMTAPIKASVTARELLESANGMNN